MTKRGILTILACFIMACFFTTTAGFTLAAEKETLKDFGIDKRHMKWKGTKWTTSHQKNIKWRMVEPWPAGNLLHNWAQHFCDSVRATSGGRLDITLYPAGALVPAMEVFDAVSEGTAECGTLLPVSGKAKRRHLYPSGPFPMGLTPR